MNGSIVGHLVKKDFALHREHILFSLLGGAIAVTLSFKGGEVPATIGIISIFVVLVVVGSMMPVSAIVNERKKQNLAFVMSLPVSNRQYTAAKLLSSVGIFLGPWLAAAISIILLIRTRGVLPDGSIPFALVLLLLPFVGFCLITASALISESEGWAIAATVVCNSSYWLVWFLIAREPELMAQARGNSPVWGGPILSILGTEIGVIVLALGLTFYFQSRKQDFV